MNILDYLKWRNDIPFDIADFNEVDSAILCELTYVEIGDYFNSNEEFITIKELSKRFYEINDYDYIFKNALFIERAPLILKDAGIGSRFADIEVGYFVNEIDEFTQFSAVVFKIKDKFNYIAFRGTDGSVVGWKEDFQLAYSDKLSGSKNAIKYLNDVALKLSGRLVLGGHSKGGNLAIYASSFCDDSVKNRIDKIYVKDSPGFNEKIINSKEYQENLIKIHSIIPEDSIIGLLLLSKFKHKIIKSSASGFFQHDLLTWEVEKDGFVLGDLSNSSKFIEQLMDEWLEKIDDDTRKSIVDTIFSIIESSKKETFKEIAQEKWKSLELIIKNIYKLPKEKQKELSDAIAQLINIAKDNAIKNITNKK